MNCDRCGTPLEIDISKREGRCDDCRKDDQDAAEKSQVGVDNSVK